jgi:hypothetical protein
MLARRGVVVLCAIAAGGCTNSDRPPPSAECTAGRQAVTEALAGAPREVRLVDGTALSECVSRAHSDGELQNLGLVLTEVAEDLEAEAAETPRAALQLGYLIGAARKGAPSESSIQAELVHRLERSAAGDLPAEARAALAEGMRAGERAG